MPGVGIKIVAALVVLVLIICLPLLMDLCMPLLACMVRWKESVNIQNSGSLKIERDKLAAGMIPPFLLLCTVFGVYSPAEGRSYGAAFGICCAAFAAYLMLRVLTRLATSLLGMKKRTDESARGCVLNFFILAVLSMTLTAFVTSLLGTDKELVGNILRWELVSFYALCLLRKTQIFAHYEGFFSGILYLCTLELIPTGMLAVSMHIL